MRHRKSAICRDTRDFALSVKPEILFALGINPLGTIDHIQPYFS